MPKVNIYPIPDDPAVLQWFDELSTVEHRNEVINLTQEEWNELIPFIRRDIPITADEKLRSFQSWIVQRRTTL